MQQQLIMLNPQWLLTFCPMGIYSLSCNGATVFDARPNCVARRSRARKLVAAYGSTYFPLALR
ncbi:hypothetical protein [Caballeronia pedi]|uniref:hypothetical protein n=1 Tax=Caballeronia pedi TaxID=1777141 RepID=UPI000B12118B|nr:hypothetical protein [Caballeronia pedi]